MLSPEVNFQFQCAVLPCAVHFARDALNKVPVINKLPYKPTNTQYAIQLALTKVISKCTLILIMRCNSPAVPQNCFICSC